MVDEITGASRPSAGDEAAAFVSATELDEKTFELLYGTLKVSGIDHELFLVAFSHARSLGSMKCNCYFPHHQALSRSGLPIRGILRY